MQDEEYWHKGLADAFLDTWTFTAHTTATDALYAALPLVTAPGHHQVQPLL